MGINHSLNYQLESTGTSKNITAEVPMLNQIYKLKLYNTFISPKLKTE